MEQRNTIVNRAAVPNNTNRRLIATSSTRTASVVTVGRAWLFPFSSKGNIMASSGRGTTTQQALPTLPPTTMSGGTVIQQAPVLKVATTATKGQHRTTPVLKRLGLYERAIQQKSHKAVRIKSMEAAWMATSCTFTPKTNTTKSNASNSNRTATTNSASSGGTTTTESVFERLYNKGSSVASKCHRSPLPTTATIPWNGGSSRQFLHQYSVRSSLSRSPTSPTAAAGRERTNSSTESRTSTAVSSRIEELYEKGTRKGWRRPATDQQERHIRDRLCEQRELQECTFRPQLYWGTKKQYPQRAASVLSHLLSSTPPPAKFQPRLPKEIIVSPSPHDSIATKHRPWYTPRRQEDLSTSFGNTGIDFMMVSPLRDPSFVDEDEKSQWITPRIIVGSTVASGSIAVTKTDETEYGSI
jgi:hypothetical protein